MNTWLVTVWCATLLLVASANELSAGEVVQLEDAESSARGVAKGSPSCMGMLMDCRAHLHGSSGHLNKMAPAKNILPKKKPTELGESGVTCINMLRECKKALIDSNSHIATWGTKKTKALIKHTVIKKRKPKAGALTKMQKLCIKMAKVSGMPLYTHGKKKSSFRGSWDKHCSGCISDGKTVAYNLRSTKCKPHYKFQRFKPHFMPLKVKKKMCDGKSKGFKRSQKRDLVACVNSCTGPCRFVTYTGKTCDTSTSCVMVAQPKGWGKAKSEIYKKTPTPQGFIPAGAAGQGCSVKSKGFQRRQHVPDLHHCATMCQGACKFVTYNAAKDCDLSTSCHMAAVKGTSETFQRHN